MNGVVRFYHCGCMPEQELFCTLAGKYVAKERSALERQIPPLNRKARRQAERDECFARGWLAEHFAGQERVGHYRDIDMVDREGYDGDEDPRAWGANNG